MARVLNGIEAYELDGVFVIAEVEVVSAAMAPLKVAIKVVSDPFAALSQAFPDFDWSAPHGVNLDDLQEL